MRVLALRFAACLIALCCLVGAAGAFAAAGRIDALEGPVSVVARGVERAARPEMEIEEGDTITTGRNAWVLLEMTDGGSLTLRPDTTLRITTYRYTGADDGSEKSVLSLVKGALRSITGAIGRYGPSNYSIATPTATIGIRGTDHEPAYYPPPTGGEKLDHEAGTYDKVNDGETFIRTPKGEVRLKPGQYGFARHDLRRPPRLLAKPPRFYQRHAEFDLKAVERRKELHRRIEEKQNRRLDERGPRDKQHAAERALKSDKKRDAREQLQRESKRAEQKERARERMEQREHQRERKEKQRRERKLEREKMRQDRREGHHQGLERGERRG